MCERGARGEEKKKLYRELAVNSEFRSVLCQLRYTIRGSTYKHITHVEQLHRVQRNDIIIFFFFFFYPIVRKRVRNCRLLDTGYGSEIGA